MVVQHNLTAMNSNRMLGLTTKSQAKSTEKLSSGYKINRAADDAAGLAISEKMRRQVRGLTQASSNAQDGISAVQTAEGALTEVHDMLQRMNELATKAANGTNSSEERDYIQSEVDALISEIDRVSETTKFNEIYLLKGEGNKEVKVATAAVEGQDFAVEYKTGYGVDGGVKAKSSAEDSNITDINGDGIFAADSDTAIKTLDALKAYMELDENGAVQVKDGVTFYKKAAADGEWGDQLDAEKVTTTTLTNLFEADNTKLLKNTGGDVAEQTDLEGAFDQETGAYTGKLYYKLTEDEATPGTGKAGDVVEVGADKIFDFVKVTPKVEAQDAGTETKTVAGDLKFNLHVGAEGNTANKIEVKIAAMSAEGIGVDGLKGSGVKTEEAATAAIETIKGAIKTVSQQRSDLGAVQNRLEHTINNLDNIVENTQSAESAIRDTDMATEMVKYANNNILAQAGQAMLAQANQANQGVLSLLG
ncbi:MAG: hypothetical protein NC420_10030 [Eubacterium sp.]|nr:hypothetical protein [Eubacterium sp.]MCM1217113.1 hypothetical protein [Lachnospiraceae bacterium]MCM1240365.1 hypothetical protein [Lachnospiraceae bacterium]